MKIIYPVYKPHLNEKVQSNVNSCIESTWISSKGEYIAQFESEFAKFVGVKHAHTVSNGTVALHLALLALGIGPGDEVIVPTLTYIATANAVKYVGAKVVFVDSDPDTWQLSPEDVRNKITKNTKAIIPAHLYGHACDMDSLLLLANEFGLKIVEDCAEAIGTKFGTKYVGTFGDINTFSFFGNKTITTGEGGMVVTNDDTLSAVVAKLKGQGLDTSREYWHDVIGYNYRMTNICAAIGCAQLEIVDEIVEKKRKIAEWYKEELDGLPLQVHGERIGTFNSYWMVSILVDPDIRDYLRDRLRAKGVETRPLFYPIHTMPMYCFGRNEYPVAQKLAASGINLPSYPDLNREDVTTIGGHIREFLVNHGK